MTTAAPSWEQAEAQIRQQYGSGVRLLGHLELHAPQGHDEVQSEWLGILPFRLAAAICDSQLRNSNEDMRSTESLADLRRGKYLTYYMCAPTDLLMRALNMSAAANTTMISGVPVMQLPLGVCEEAVHLEPPIVLPRVE